MTVIIPPGQLSQHRQMIRLAVSGANPAAHGDKFFPGMMITH